MVIDRSCSLDSRASAQTLQDPESWFSLTFSLIFFQSDHQTDLILCDVCETVHKVHFKKMVMSKGMSLFMPCEIRPAHEHDFSFLRGCLRGWFFLNVRSENMIENFPPSCPTVDLKSMSAISRPFKRRFHDFHQI